MSENDRGGAPADGVAVATDRERREAPLWSLVSETPNTVADLRFGPGVHTVGSGEAATLRVVHPTVSRRHARISCTEDGVGIEDLGSTNGTVVDGRAIVSPVTVRGRTTLVLGDVVLTLAPEREAPPPRREPDSGASMLLGPATFGFLRDAGDEVAFAAGDVVVRRKEQNEYFYVVIEGDVELTLCEGGPRQRPLARLGPGAVFGAESVLSRDGAAVDAVAVTDVRLLRYPASQLPTALQESESLRRKLLGGIARNLHQTAADALNLLKGTEVIARLVQGDADSGSMVAVSARMRGVVKRIRSCAETDAPVLIVGEDGTGRTLAARTIHAASQRAHGPIIAVSCRDLAPEHAAELILGEDLGGSLPTESAGSGGIHLAHDGTLVLRGVDSLDAAAQRFVAGYLRRRSGGGDGSFPDPRVIATCRGCDGDGSRGGLVESLRECFGQVIELPPLAERPKDVLPLAETFLERHGPHAPILSEAARHVLLGLRYRRRNVAELREIIDLAVRIADGPEIRSEHVLGGVGDDATPGLDITDAPLVHRLLRPAGIRAVRLLTLVGFAAVIGVCLALSASWLGRAANTVVWAVWEPVVFGLFLLVGPVWCTVCPLSTAARVAKRLGGAERSPPAWVVRHGPWMATVGFAAIVWVEGFFHSTANPVASGALLAALLLGAVGFALVYRREVWCRHLCPLGRLATVLAPAAPLQIAARPRVCASTCTTHACFKGTDSIPGCTVFHHPLEARQAYRCKLCLDCLRSCPHGSARLQIRPPLVTVGALDTAASDLAMFAAGVSLLALALLASQAFPLLAGPVPFTAMCVGAVAAGLLIHRLLLGAGANTDEARLPVLRASLALMILGWGALMAVQLANVPVLADSRIVLPHYPWLPPWVPPEVTVLSVLQIALVAGAAVLAAFTVAPVASRRSSAVGRVGRFAVAAVFAAYAGAAVILVAARI